MTTTITLPLVQSRRGGKVHLQGCSHSAMSVKQVKGRGMTRQEIADLYGTKLCSHCFPWAKDIARNAPVRQESSGQCPGSLTSNWEVNPGAEDTGTCGVCGGQVRRWFADIMEQHAA